MAVVKEAVKLVPQERVQQRTVEHAPVPQSLEETVELVSLVSRERVQQLIPQMVGENVDVSWSHENAWSGTTSIWWRCRFHNFPMTVDRSCWMTCLKLFGFKFLQFPKRLKESALTWNLTKTHELRKQWSKNSMKTCGGSVSPGSLLPLSQALVRLRPVAKQVLSLGLSCSACSVREGPSGRDEDVSFQYLAISCEGSGDGPGHCDLGKLPILDAGGSASHHGMALHHTCGSGASW